MAGETVINGTGGADTVSFLKSATGVVYDGGAGNDAITGSTKDDVIRGGAGVDRIMGGAGNDSFVIVAGDLMSSYASNNGQNGMLDQIIDFQGAGSNAASGFQDKLELYGFSSDAVITFEKYVSEYVTVDGVKSLVQNMTKQVYKISDPNNPGSNGYIIVQMADGTSKLTADDVVFKSAIIGGTGTGDVVEAGFNEAGDADASGKISAALFDQATSFKAASAEALAGKYGNFTFNTDGSWTYVLDNALAATQHLNRNDTVTEVLKVQTLDGTTVDITVNVHGTNDAPAVTALDAGTVSEKNAPVIIDLLQGQTDPDTGDTLTATGISITDNLGNAVTFVNNGDGTISIDPSQYGALNNGDSCTLTVSYGVSDGLAIVANTASLKITGVTDYDENRDAEATANHGVIIIDTNQPHILRGSQYNDAISGLGGDDTIYGGGGDDLLNGGNGVDTIWGGSGCDAIGGSLGDDRLYGGSGADVIDGLNGEDIIDGGTGNDLLTGGLGADTFVFRANSGQDTITDFFGSDKIQLVDLGITSANFASHVTIVQNFLSAEVIIDGNPANTITIFGLGAGNIDKNDFLFV